jgi:hypothetical protein
MFYSIRRNDLEEGLTEFQREITKDLLINKSSKMLININKNYDKTKSFLISNQILLIKNGNNENYKYVDMKKELINPIQISNENNQFSLKNEEQAYIFSKDIYNSFISKFAKRLYSAYRKYLLRKNAEKLFKKIKVKRIVIKVVKTVLRLMSRKKMSQFVLETKKRIIFLQRRVKLFLIMKENKTVE